MATRDPKQPVIFDLEDDDSVALIPWAFVADRLNTILTPILDNLDLINSDLDICAEQLHKWAQESQ